MDAIESAIQAALLGIPECAKTEQWIGEVPWSVAVKTAIVAVGRKFGWLTAANGCETDEGKEFLYDVIWFQSDNEKYMTDVPLVAECEWHGKQAIEYDFQKLLIARSKYKVMVFQANSADSVYVLLKKMRLWITKFNPTNTGDRYLLAGWAKSHWIFELHVE